MKNLSFKIQKYELRIQELETENIKLRLRIKNLEKAIENFRNSISDTLT